ncbi:hypothetical protein BKA65DRAFT_19343 [Rhexocercosporidium sp. MPI-PUGE-AT-0058]|nr:hypothetical protein BKA65DRAFT_19343 [Rhexocercosporidium sp. MPI-PUGE-AT-0058]
MKVECADDMTWYIYPSIPVSTYAYTPIPIPCNQSIYSSVQHFQRLQFHTDILDESRARDRLAQWKLISIRHSISCVSVFGRQLAVGSSSCLSLSLSSTHTVQYHRLLHRQAPAPTNCPTATLPHLRSHLIYDFTQHRNVCLILASCHRECHVAVLYQLSSAQLSPLDRLARQLLLAPRYWLCHIHLRLHLHLQYTYTYTYTTLHPIVSLPSIHTSSPLGCSTRTAAAAAAPAPAPAPYPLSTFGDKTNPKVLDDCCRLR